MPMLTIWCNCILRTIGRAWRGRVLSQDMTTVPEYLQTWRPSLATEKTVTTVFYLNNREAKRELAVYNSNNLMPF